MAIEDDIRDALDNAGSLSAVADRIAPDTLQPGEVLPAISYQRISAPTEQPMGGTRVIATLARYQFNIEALDPDTRAMLRDSLIDVLCGFTGTTIHVSDRILANSQDDYDPTTQVYRSMVDWQVLYD